MGREERGESESRNILERGSGEREERASLVIY